MPLKDVGISEEEGRKLGREEADAHTQKKDPKEEIGEEEERERERDKVKKRNKKTRMS